MQVIIDCFEEDIAVVELDGKMLKAPRQLFCDAREGDTVELRVLPRGESDHGDDTPAAIFAKLRRKHRRNAGKKPHFE